MNNEIKEIKKITSEIDTIMFGEKNKFAFKKDWEKVVAFTIIGFSTGLGISYTLGYTDSKGAIPPLVLTLTGAGTGYFSNIKTMTSIYKEYEEAYLNLSREEQIEILKLSKKLFLLYKKEIQKGRNKKFIKKYLQISNEDTMCEDTMFSSFELNHPQLKLLTNKEIEDIHKKGKLTPTEKFYEWRELNYCPANDVDEVRCNNYETCRDCTVAWANEKDEWDKMKTIPIEAVYNLEYGYEQLNFKKSKDTVKIKIKKA